MAITKKTFIDPPPINENLSILIFVINIFCPGIGTIIVGLIKCHLESLFIGVLQSLLTILFIGWVWSIWWGLDLMKISKQTIEIPNAVGVDTGLLHVNVVKA